MSCQVDRQAWNGRWDEVCVPAVRSHTFLDHFILQGCINSTFDCRFTTLCYTKRAVSKSCPVKTPLSPVPTQLMTKPAVYAHTNKRQHSVVHSCGKDAHVHVEVRGQPWISWLRSLPSFVVVCLRPQWLAGQHCPSISPCFTSTVFTRRHQHVQLVIRILNSGLKFVWPALTDSAISPAPT